jgi:polar amino acid transport system substrate-binding protein
LVLLFSAGTLIGAQKLEESALKKVLDRGVLRVSILGDFEPWCYLDENYEWTGYDVEVARLMAKELGVKLEFVETGTAGRIPYLVTGKVDIIIAGLGATPERAKSVAYSKPYAGVIQALVAPKDSDIKSYKDCSGKKVAVARGTTSDKAFTEIAPEGTIILRFEENVDSFLALEQGKVDAVADGGWAFDSAQVKKHPEWEIKGAFYKEVLFLAVRLEDQIWLNWVNMFLACSVPHLNELHEKYFGEPLPEEVTPNYQ